MSFIGISNNIWVGSPGTGGGTPFGWVLTSGTTRATLDIDFVHGLAYNSPANVSIPSLLSCTRATPAAAYYTNADGTLKTFAANTLRYGSNGLLVEEQRINIIIQSQTLGNAAWSNSACSVSSDVITAPDGTLTADKIVEDTGNSLHTITTTAALTILNATAYTISFYAKAGERAFVAVSGDGNSGFLGANPGCWTLSGSGTYTSPGGGVTGTITALANGWYYCTQTATSTGVTVTPFVSLRTSAAATFQTYVGDGVSGAYVWGVQLEAGAFATSYIPTTTVSVTRADELVGFAGNHSIFTPAAGTYYVQTLGLPNTGRYLVSGTVDANFELLGSANQWKIEVRNLEIGATSGVSDSLNSKIAGAYATTAESISANGNAVGTIITANAITQTTALFLGGVPGPGQSVPTTGFINTYMKRFAFWNIKLSDAALQTLTT